MNTVKVLLVAAAAIFGLVLAWPLIQKLAAQRRQQNYKDATSGIGSVTDFNKQLEKDLGFNV